MTQKYNLRGWIPDKPDSRDVLYAVHPLTETPEALNLRERWRTPPLDQLTLGRCGPMSVKSEILYDQEQDPLPDLEPCSLYTYFNTRLLMGTVNQDSGVSIRTMFKSLVQYGWCQTRFHTEDIHRFTERPSPAAYADGAKRKLQRYERVPQSQVAMEGAIAQGDPFLIGFMVGENIDQARRDGYIRPLQGRIIGGHAVLVCGYDRRRRRFQFRNSWGQMWGDGGYGEFDYEYLLDPQLASDFWTGHYGSDQPAPPGPPTPPPAPDLIDWQKIIALLLEFLGSAKQQICPIWLGGLRADVQTMIAKAPAEWQGVLKMLSGMLDAWCPSASAATMNLAAGAPEPRRWISEWEAWKQSVASLEP